VGFSALGFSEAVDRYLLSQVPLYAPVSGYQPHHWMSVETGHWAGVVREQQSRRLVVETLDGEVWCVCNDQRRHTARRDAMVPPPQNYIQVIGTTTSDGMCDPMKYDHFRGVAACAMRA
jgi:hypothetical protein